jgi:hypothetical protein
MSDGQRQSRLPHTTGTSQCQETDSALLQQFDNCRDLALSADQRCQWDREPDHPARLRTVQRRQAYRLAG